jgi:FKBP-type peptidyl-prolyl cis-trans isomerase FkpA
MIKKYLGITLLALVILSSCKKETRDLKVIEDQQIQAFIKTNNLTGFSKDTSGFYYQILSNGTGEQIKYSTSVIFSQKTTSINESVSFENSIYTPISNYVGYITPISWRQTMIRANKGAVLRILTPSYLAFGKDGSGSSIPGNAILDTKITVANDADRPSYEDNLIKDFLNTNNIIATKDAVSGLYYQIITPGTGNPVLPTSTIKAVYKGRLLTGTVFDQATSANPLSIALSSVIQGWQTGLPFIKSGGKIRLFIPSRLGYGSAAQNGIPANSILDFDIELVEVTN